MSFTLYTDCSSWRWTFSIVLRSSDRWRKNDMLDDMTATLKRTASKAQNFLSSNQATLSQLLNRILKTITWILYRLQMLRSCTLHTYLLETVSPLLQRSTSLLCVWMQTPLLLLAISKAKAKRNRLICVGATTIIETLTSTRMTIADYFIRFALPARWIMFENKWWFALLRKIGPAGFNDQNQYCHAEKCERRINRNIIWLAIIWRKWTAVVRSMTAQYLQCQQCDSKYHTLLWTRFNHFLNARKFTKRIRTYQTKENSRFHNFNNQIELTASCFWQTKNIQTLLSSATIRVAHFVDVLCVHKNDIRRVNRDMHAIIELIAWA